MTDCLKSLCALDGVSGCEDAVADYIINEIKPYAECYIDPLGNVVAHKKGAKAGKKRVLFDAHMDEVGLIITSVREDGFLTFSCVGGINTEALLARRVKIGRIYGVICVKPVHMLTGDEKINCPTKRVWSSASAPTTKPKPKNTFQSVIRPYLTVILSSLETTE